MDFADSVTYSVHDLLDFYQAGLVPIGSIRDDLPEHLERFKTSKKVKPDAVDAHAEGLENLVDLLPGREYQGTHADRVLVAQTSSWLISQFVGSATLRKADGDLSVAFPEATEIQMRFSTESRLVLRDRRPDAGFAAGGAGTNHPRSI